MKFNKLHLLVLAQQGLLTFAQDPPPNPKEVAARAKCDALSPSPAVCNSLQPLTAKEVISVRSALALPVSPFPELSHARFCSTLNTLLPSDTDPKTGAQGCCDGDTVFKTDAKATKEGACCDEGQEFSFDSASGKGACCAPGEKFTGGKCQVPQKDPPPATGETKDPCNKCSSHYVCACDGTLGIKYGKCYTMTDVNGLQLNRDVYGTYQSGGDIGNLIFKVKFPVPAAKALTCPRTERG